MVDELNQEAGNPRLRTARQRWNQVREHKFEKSYREDSKINLKYFTGEDQGWDEDGARAELEQEGRPALTLNRLKPIIRLIIGARPKTEPRYAPVEEGDVETADILNSCKNHVEDLNHWQFVEDDWFKLGTILSRSVVELTPIYDMDPRGEIELRLHDGFQFWFDPDSRKKDRTDGDWMFQEVLLNPKEAKRLWPKKVAQVDNLVGHVERGDEDPAVSRDSGEADEYQDPRSNYYDKATKKLRVLYYWYKIHKTYSKIIDTMTADVFDSPLPPETVKSELSGEDRFNVVPVDFTMVKYMVFSHDIIFEEGDNPWERNDGRPTKLSTNFPFVIFEPERIYAGTSQELTQLIKDLRDPQKFHNKIASAILHILGSQSNAGWEYEKGALSPQEKKKLKKWGSKPGVHIEWEKGVISENRRQRIMGGEAPQSHLVTAREMAQEELDISGVESLVSTESTGKGASGKAIALKQAQGGNIISWLYTSFRFFQHQLAQYELDAMQHMYDYERVIRIKGNRPRFVKINEAVYDYMGGVSAVLNDITIGEYDVAIADKEVLPTERMERFIYFTELVKSGALPLPPEILIKIAVTLMDDPELKDIVENELGPYLQQQQMLMAQQGMPVQGAA